MADTIYRLEGVVKVYGTREACHIDALEIYKEEIFCIMGHNGGEEHLASLAQFSGITNIRGYLLQRAKV